MESVLVEAFFECAETTNYSDCKSVFNDYTREAQCTWTPWEESAWDLDDDDVVADEPGDCRVYDKCDVDNKFRCEQVGCSWRPYNNNLGDEYAGQCARRPSESYQGNKDDPALWKT